MLIAILIACVVFGLSGGLHYFVMSRLLAGLPHSGWPRGLQLLIGLYGVGAAHLAEAGLYAAGFLTGRHWGIGGFEGADDPMTIMDVYYFSLVNYTSLGLGDIYPTGHLRFIAGVESLNGFLLISCSAAFIYLLMSGNQKQSQN